jgi:2-haloacid dehalogenase
LEPRFLCERLIDDEQALDAFLRDVVTVEWHLQHDAGHPLPTPVPGLPPNIPSMGQLVAYLDQRDALMGLGLLG